MPKAMSLYVNSRFLFSISDRRDKDTSELCWNDDKWTKERQKKRKNRNQNINTNPLSYLCIYWSGGRRRRRRRRCVSNLCIWQFIFVKINSTVQWLPVSLFQVRPKTHTLAADIVKTIELNLSSRTSWSALRTRTFYYALLRTSHLILINRKCQMSRRATKQISKEKKMITQKSADWLTHYRILSFVISLNWKCVTRNDKNMTCVYEFLDTKSKV